MDNQHVDVFLTHSGEGCRHLIGRCRITSVHRAARLLAARRVPKRWRSAYAPALVACSEGSVGYYVGDHVRVHGEKITVYTDKL